ncbi:MFS transporter [Nonomuraea salmonea]|uniref:MFS transporter n=1 Tax=Nonomuraea salmonea TaxID=46181 RepID=UPI002FEA6085
MTRPTDWLRRRRPQEPPGGGAGWVRWRRSPGGGAGWVLPWRRSPGVPGGDDEDHAQGFDRRLIAPMILGSILNPINSSMLAVALIPIGAAFGAPPSETAWLVSGLYLATAVGQPVIGRLVDMYGPRLLYLLGTALVGIAGGRWRCSRPTSAC